MLFIDRLLLGLVAVKPPKNNEKQLIFRVIFKGIVYPSLQCLISNWAPPAEKGRFVAALMGNTLGTALTFPLVGEIATRWGWKWSFHFTTFMVLVYCVIFWFVGSNDPKSHKWISEEEKEFITKAQQSTVVTASTGKVPRILLSVISNGLFFVFVVLL